MKKILVACGTGMATSTMISEKIKGILEEKGIKVYKALVGPFACSMDMAGMSVTLMKLDDELKELMDAPCDTPYFTQK